NKILMPAVDFDSTDPGSYKSRANQVYSTGQFAQLLKDSPTTTLNGITYVTGNAHIKKGQALIINGVLVSDGTITIGNGFSSESTPATLDVNHVAGQPSGVLAKNNITVGGFSSNMTVDGLVYSGGSFTLMGGNWSEGVSLIINGGIISQNIDLFSMWLPVNITLNQPYINETLGSPIFSQVLSINHWEEEY
ncbi:MAG: hypothetical protein Q8L21_02925, partial [Candidatus Komeilibacteria bacterium]|nr:hypothetical protein [Candidatus Komeilibacteria bacterium]